VVVLAGMRQTEVYFHLLEKLDPFLFDLPWAAAGVAPQPQVESDPALTTAYHEWGRWLRVGRRRELERLVCEGGLGGLGAFDMSQVRRCFRNWCAEPPDAVGLTEPVLQLAGIELLRRRFDLVCPGDRTTWSDRLRARVYSSGRASSPGYPPRGEGKGTGMNPLHLPRPAEIPLDGDDKDVPAVPGPPRPASLPRHPLARRRRTR